MPIYPREHTHYSYMGRTRFNADMSDLTIAFTVDQFTAGERQTRKLATEAKYLHIDLNTASPTCAALEIHNRMSLSHCSIINIAGNGIFTLIRHGWTQEQVNQYLFDVFCEMKEKWHKMPTKGFRSGGQTGVDMAAGVMAYLLQADAVITFPKGYRQRGADGQDFTQTREDINVKIINMAKDVFHKNHSIIPEEIR